MNQTSGESKLMTKKPAYINRLVCSILALQQLWSSSTIVIARCHTQIFVGVVVYILSTCLPFHLLLQAHALYLYIILYIYIYIYIYIYAHTVSRAHSGLPRISVIHNIPYLLE